MDLVAARKALHGLLRSLEDAERVDEHASQWQWPWLASECTLRAAQSLASLHPEVAAALELYVERLQETHAAARTRPLLRQLLAAEARDALGTVLTVGASLWAPLEGPVGRPDRHPDQRHEESSTRAPRAHRLPGHT
jgi:hypothetical protein